MPLKIKSLLNLILAGEKLSLEAEYNNKKKVDGSNTPNELLFKGKAIGLNIKPIDVVNDLFKKIDTDFINKIPEGFIPDIILNDIYVAFSNATGNISLIALTSIEDQQSQRTHELQLLFQYNAGHNNSVQASYVFGILTNFGNLENLPLVGGEMKDVTLNGVGFIYTSQAANFKLPVLSGGIDGTREITFPDEGKDYNAGFNFIGEVIYLKTAAPLALTLPVGNNNAETSNSSNSTPVPASSFLPNAKWFKVEKKLGPVTVGQIGFAYQDDNLTLLISGDLTIANLSISLYGLGVCLSLSNLFKEEFSASFLLQGIGLSYSAPPLEISASFIRTQDEKGNDVYNGTAILKASKFTISALGSYAKVDGQTSLFIYGIYEGAIGGPAFFFVTGIAAGFGYNRKVNLPSIEEVALFPLVALAMKPENESQSLNDVMSQLQTPMKSGKTPIEISLGDYWLAIGIKFTSFKIIESFVLLTVNFGTRLEFALLGLSILKWPEESISPTPIVYIELAILAHFGPQSDLISVESILTPNSYLFSKDCKLSGGFAFYTWVSGPHEGDFVVTLGGYHPKFIKPDHYPTVPRLALNWKISDVVIIKGEMYYAITPSNIMAGGKWEVLFQIPVVTASVTVWADMLINWAPFQYKIDMGICVKIEANITIVFVSIHFSLEMHAELHIWGPPFAGEAYVDWTIFSFTIPFGDSSKEPPKPLSWEEFNKGFIPHNKQETKQAGNSTGNTQMLLAGAPPKDSSVAPDPISVVISNGMIDVKGPDKKFPVINPHQLMISVDSFIPVTALRFNPANDNAKQIDDATKMVSSAGNSTYGDRVQELGIRPCGLTTDDGLQFLMDVTLTLEGVTEDAAITCVAKGVTDALWGSSPNTNNNANPGTAKVIPKVLTGLIIQPNPLPQVSATGEYDFSKLFDVSEKEFDWEFMQVQVGEAYQVNEVLGALKTYNNAEGKRQHIRQHILSLLRQEFDESLPAIDEKQMEEIMMSGETYFKAIPVLCEIGQIPQYPT